jgi:hypothetical protein
MPVRIALIAAVGALFLAFVPTALAGKRPGGGKPGAGGGTISLVLSTRRTVCRTMASG